MRQSGTRALDAAQKTRADSMHDIRAIRENPDAFDRDLARRGLAPLSAEL
ncbi:MAG: serine--tRNA ligase, partial [Actinomycetospora chiangmaiensis]|nr:serine--tRNA ligase [Actinomycetospora chiangmaiensis]